VLVPRSTRAWSAGWARDGRCPPDLRSEYSPGGAGWRELGPAAAGEWREVHGVRARVVRLLRRAGYVARWRWARVEEGARRVGPHVVPRWTYRAGPAAGLEAVDPWRMARRLMLCSAAWYAQARITSADALRVVAQPRPCGQVHVCPVCARRRSWTLATALRAAVEEDHAAGVVRGVALVTLTHRDEPGATLRAELARFRRAWDSLTRGRAGMAWRQAVTSWFVGLEVTRGAAGARGELGHGWHVHAHVIVGVQDAESARWIGERWRAATLRASQALLGNDRGAWLPGAGGVWSETHADGWIPAGRPTWTPADGYGWFRPIGADRAAIFQAAKYPTPAVELHPIALAEFVSVAHGRRWHEGGGTWRGVRRRALELEAAGESNPNEAPGYDVGVNVSRAGPRDAPALDDVATGIGAGRCRRCGADGDHNCAARELGEVVSWKLTKGAERARVVAAAMGAGGDIDARGRLVVPRAAAAALLREWAAAGRAAREARAALP